MQTSAPELIDIAGETAEDAGHVRRRAGQARRFANNCLLARRLVERGVRFVQLYHTDWDHHGGAGADLGKPFDQVCREVDQPCAALITRPEAARPAGRYAGGLGRRVRPHADGRGARAPSAATTTSTPTPCGWPAAASNAALTSAHTDELGFAAVEDRVHVHDLQATILHLLGLDHTKLTFRSRAATSA